MQEPRDARGEIGRTGATVREIGHELLPGVAQEAGDPVEPVEHRPLRRGVGARPVGHRALGARREELRLRPVGGGPGGELGGDEHRPDEQRRRGGPRALQSGRRAEASTIGTAESRAKSAATTKERRNPRVTVPLSVASS